MQYNVWKDQSKSAQVDNRSLASKIAVRKWLLDQMHITHDVRVLDTCSGLGAVWTEMEKHCTIARWTRCDNKVRRPGTLKVDAVSAVKSLTIQDFNVIDIDPYGDPFDIYFALLSRLHTLDHPLGVLVTHGHVRENSAKHVTLAMIGIPPSWDTNENPVPSIPPAFIAERVFQRTWDFANITAAGVINYSIMGPKHLSGASYYALVLEPKSLTEFAPTKRAIAIE